MGIAHLFIIRFHRPTLPQWRPPPYSLTDAAQQVAWSADDQPFGELVRTSAAVDHPLRFPGQYYDAESGLHYNYFRDYDPQTGRYVQSDSIGLAGGLNTYAYVGGNPISRIDPTGEWFFLPALLGGLGGTATTTGGLTLGQIIIGGAITGIILSVPGDSRTTSGNSGNTSGAETGNPDPCQVDPNLCGNSESSGIIPGRPELPRGSVLIRRDVRTVKSVEFKSYCEQNNLPGKNWTYVMETWRTPDGRLIERHYWSHTSGNAFYHK